MDWFAVELEAGKTYRIDLKGAPSSNGTLRDLRIRGVYDDDGDKALGTSTTGNTARARGQDDQLLFAPDTSGTYYIAASSLVQIRTGTYTLSVTEVDTSEADAKSRSTAKTVEVGDVDNPPPTEEISADTERDWYAVELEADVRYRIDMEGVYDDLPGPALERPRVVGVYDEHGERVDHVGGFRGTRFAVLEIEPPNAGTYYIVLGRVAGTDSGRYRLSVTTGDYRDYTATAGTVEVGGSATGEIETAGDVDWFKVDLLAGTTYEIDVLGSDFIAGALRDPYLVGIYDSNGVLIENTTNDDSRLQVRTAGSISMRRPAASTTSPFAVPTAVPEPTAWMSMCSRMWDDDYADDTSTTGTVAVGGFATGRIEDESDRGLVRGRAPGGGGIPDRPQGLGHVCRHFGRPLTL